MVALPCFVAAVLALWVLQRDSYDLRIFLAAGRAVLDGNHPYASTVAKVQSGSAFVYPLPAAWVFAPIAHLSPDVARTVYALVSAGAITAGLLALGVRRITIATAVGLSAFAVRSLTLGTVEPLMFLLLALVWRLRDRAVASGVVLACAIMLKPVAAPVLLFMILTRRLTAAAVTVGVAAALWIAAGGRSFHSVTTYTSMLHTLADAEATMPASLSTVRVLTHVMSQGAASVLVALLGLGLLLAAGLLARRSGMGDGAERAVFAVAILVGIGASPVLWAQYFLLVLLALVVLRVPPVCLYVIFVQSWFITPDRIWVVSPSHYVSWPGPGAAIWMAQLVLLFALVAAFARVLAPSRNPAASS